MVKLEANKKLLTHSSANWKLKNDGDVFDAVFNVGKSSIRAYWCKRVFLRADAVFWVVGRYNLLLIKNVVNFLIVSPCTTIEKTTTI